MSGFIKLETKMAGVFASASFMLVAMVGYASTLNAVHALLYGFLASAVLGFIGHKMGTILAHPKGHLEPRSNTHMAIHPSTAHDNQPVLPTTGEETFLEDVEP